MSKSVADAEEGDPIRVTYTKPFHRANGGQDEEGCELSGTIDGVDADHDLIHFEANGKYYTLELDDGDLRSRSMSDNTPVGHDATADF